MKSEVFIWEGVEWVEGGRLGPLFLNFLDPPLESSFDIWWFYLNGTTPLLMLSVLLRAQTLLSDQDGKVKETQHVKLIP